MESNDLAGAETSFARAVELNPGKPDYVLALAVLREHHLTALVQDAAKARLAGDNARADRLLQAARALDPENSIITQHLTEPLSPPISPQELPGSGKAPALAGTVALAPAPGTRSIHRRGGPEDLVNAVYSAFGITVTFDSSVTGGAQGKLDLDDVDFATAGHVVAQMTHTFAIPVQPKSAIIAKDTQDVRNRLAPQVEETIYLPGITTETMTELATLARTVFDLKQVTASPSAGDMLVRGDESTLRLLNATYADMLDGGSDVLLELRLYEVDKSRMRNIGAQLPGSIGGFSVATEALNLINSNQSLIQQAIANGILKLTGNPAIDYPAELAVLYGAGLLNVAQFTNLLGTVGTLSGLPLLGVFLGSSTTFNLLLNSSEARTLDAVQVRSSSNQPANFRAGTRYPIVTATYSSGLSSGLASSIAGIASNNSTVNQLLQQYLGGSSTLSIPQIQYEDLGITLKATPRVLRNGDVSLQLDMKIEALGGGSINNIPILNSRQLTSMITIPQGQTALLASEVSRNESRSVQGLPYLSEIPGFQSTDKSDEQDYGELLITITPHVVRSNSMRIASKRLAVAQPSTEGGGAVE